MIQKEYLSLVASWRPTCVTCFKLLGRYLRRRISYKNAGVLLGKKMGLIHANVLALRPLVIDFQIMNLVQVYVFSLLLLPLG